MMGGEGLIKARAKTPEIAEKLLGYIQAMEKRILDCGVDVRGSQPTGDNIAGGTRLPPPVQQLGALVRE